MPIIRHRPQRPPWVFWLDVAILLLLALMVILIVSKSY